MTMDDATDEYLSSVGPEWRRHAPQHNDAHDLAMLPQDLNMMPQDLHV